MFKEFDPEKTTEDYEEEYMKELKFDKYALDDEFNMHTEKYMGWAKLYAKALVARKMAEEEVDKVKGQVDIDVRKTPSDFDLEPDSKGKIMETAIKSAVITDGRVEDAKASYYRVYELTHILEAAVKAFEHRKELLKATASLWEHEYYSNPIAKEAVKEIGNKEKNRREVHDVTSPKKRGRRRDLS